jgi:hypothetical protein
MSTKQAEIEAKKAKPIAVGDTVAIAVPYSYKETVTEGKGKKKITKTVVKDQVFETTGKVMIIDCKPDKPKLYKVELGSISIPTNLDIKTNYEGHTKYSVFKAEYVSPTFTECGSNPFKKENYRVSFYNKDVWALLFAACYAKRDDNFVTPNYSTHNGQDGDRVRKEFAGKTYGGVNFDPYVIDANGEKQHYQRGLVWTLEQKQLLIDSIYNNIEIGKFLFRHNTWARMEKGMIENGHGYSWDCVDGKQRFFAILHFIQNKYPDTHGNYWSDLSADAHRRFLGYGNLSYGEMGDDAKDVDVVTSFLTLNFTGTPMSKEHIEFVKSINMK